MFVNYSHPADLKDPAKRRVVSSAASKSRRIFGNLATKHAPGTFTWRKNSPDHDSPSESPISTPRYSEVASLEVREENQEAGKSNQILSDASSHDTPGGVCQEPCNSFPVEATGIVPLAIDYYTKTFGPWKDTAISEWCQLGGRPMMTQYLPFAMQSDIAFEGLVLTMIADSHDSTFGSAEQRQQAIEFHRNNLLVKLNQRLADPHMCYDDVSLHSILSLINAEVSFSSRDKHPC